MASPADDPSASQEVKIVLPRPEAAPPLRPAATYRLSDLAEYKELVGHPQRLESLSDQGFRKGSPDIVRCDEAFADRFYSAVPHLVGFDLKEHSLVFAGEAAGLLLMTREVGGMLRPGCPETHTFDLHPIDARCSAGCEAGSCCQCHRDFGEGAINALAAHVHAACKASGARLQVTRDASHITLVPKPASSRALVVIRVCLRVWADIGELLASFDVDADAVGFTGETVVLSARGAFAAQHGANRVSLQDRRPGYELRLARSFNHGFDLILPRLVAAAVVLGDLDREALTHVESLNALRRAQNQPEYLPFLRLEGGPVPWRFAATRMDSKGTPSPPGRPRWEEAEAAEEHWDQVMSPYADDARASVENLNALCRAARDARPVPRLRASSVYRPETDITRIQPVIDLEVFCSYVCDLLTSPSRLCTAVKSLRVCLGHERTIRVLSQLVDLAETPTPPAQMPGLRAEAEAAWADLRARLGTLPFQLARGPPPRAAVPPETWYGSACAGTAASEDWCGSACAADTVPRGGGPAAPAPGLSASGQA